VVFDLSHFGRSPTTVTHAGLLASGWRQPVRGLIRNRFVDKDGRPLPLSADNSTPEGAQPWDCLHDPARGRVVYGHNVWSLEEPRVNNDCYGIDTGACFGGRLTGYIEDLATGAVEFVQVQARKAYSER
jgi:diadenosine tetraphosphatase ApaH/serine/threonine PP2A family protein phosphatase